MIDTTKMELRILDLEKACCIYDELLTSYNPVSIKSKADLIIQARELAK